MSKLINFYDKLPKKYRSKKIDNPNFKQHLISLPAFICISGRTSAGKTNSLVNLLHLMGNTFDKLIICCKNFDSDPLYVYMKDKCPESVEVYEDEIPDLDKYDLNKQYMIVFDDLLNDKDKIEPIQTFFKRGRKRGFSACFLTQDYFMTCSFVRKNLSHLFLFGLTNKTEQDNILRNYPFMKKYMHLLDELPKKNDKDPNNFINIDIGAGKARLNFNSY